MKDIYNVNRMDIEKLLIPDKMYIVIKESGRYEYNNVEKES